MDNNTISQVFCTNCGSKVSVEDAFCTNCGAKVEQVIEQPKKQFCTNCGNELEAGQSFCVVCGQRVLAEEQQVYQRPPVNTPSRSNKLWIILVAAGVTTILIFILAFFGIREMQKQELHDQLAYTDWYTYDNTLKLKLKFGSSTIDYDAYSVYFGTVDIGDYTYEVIDGDTIEVNGQEIDVEVDSDSVSFSPSFINSDSYSYWTRDW